MPSESQLFDRLVELTKQQKRHDDAYPDVGMGRSYISMVKDAVSILKEEAKFWESDVEISDRLVKMVEKYFGKTSGELPFEATWDEWKALGKGIIKGQKASGRNAKGVATFGYWQVTEPNRYYPVYVRDDDMYPYKYSTPEQYYSSPEPEPVYYSDGSGYLPRSGPCGPLYFDRNGEI